MGKRARRTRKNAEGNPRARERAHGRPHKDSHRPSGSRGVGDQGEKMRQRRPDKVGMDYQKLRGAYHREAMKGAKCEMMTKKGEWRRGVKNETFREKVNYLPLFLPSVSHLPFPNFFPLEGHKFPLSNLGDLAGRPGREKCKSAAFSWDEIWGLVWDNRCKSAAFFWGTFCLQVCQQITQNS